MSLSQSFSQKIGNVRPLNPCPSLDIDFANGGYVTDLGFADQASVGSANFKIGAFNGPDPIFTRSSAATFRGSNGLIQYAPENLLQYSEQFDATPYWTPNQVAVAPNQITSPSGLVNAYRLTTNGSAAVQRIGQNSTLVGVSTYSIYVKAGTASFVQILHGSSVNVYANFNVSTGSVGNVGALTTASIQSVGNGWYRCVVSTAAIITGSSWYIYIAQSNTAAYGAAFSATVANLYIWGAQLERSSTARPYISTTTTARYGPRFEYDLNGNPLGLLMEEQSNNSLLYSERFDVTSSWTATNLVVAGNQIASPSGFVDADRLTTSGAAAIQRISQNSTQTGVSTYSIYVKAGTASFIQVVHGSSANVYANFNVSTGVAGNVGSSATSSIVSVGNGWYRCVVSATIASTSSWHLYIVHSNTAAYGAAFSATVANLYVWGAQLEAKPFATSYMPTVGGTMTRNADVVNSTIGSWFNQPEGTIVVSGDRSHSPSLNASLYDSFYEFGDGGGGYHSAHFSDGTAEEFFGDNGAYATSAVGITTIGTFTGIASSYSSNDIYTTRDGITPNSAASATFVATPTTLNIGYSQAVTQAWNGHIKTFRYYPKALPDKLQRLSS